MDLKISGVSGECVHLTLPPHIISVQVESWSMLGVIQKVRSLRRREGESAKSRGLCDNVAYVGAWIALVCGLCGSNVYVGCVGYEGQNIFYVVIIFTWVAWVKNFFAWVNFFKWFKIFWFSAWVKIFWGSKFWRESFLGGESKEISIDAFTSVFRIFFSSTLCSSR